VSEPKTLQELEDEYGEACDTALAAQQKVRDLRRAIAVARGQLRLSDARP
jgi:hypothetical protein